MLLNVMQAFSDGTLMAKMDAALQGVAGAINRYDAALARIEKRLEAIEQAVSAQQTPREITTGANGVLVTGAHVVSDAGIVHHG